MFMRRGSGGYIIEARMVEKREWKDGQDGQPRMHELVEEGVGNKEGAVK
jgi:hypothetical protein